MKQSNEIVGGSEENGRDFARTGVLQAGGLDSKLFASAKYP